MKKLLVLLALIGIVVVAASQAHAVVLNFDDLEDPGNSLTLIPSYSNSGFDLTSSHVSSGAFVSAQQANGLGMYLGSASLANNFHGAVTILSSSGNLFSLYSIDLSQFPDSAFNMNIVFTAYDSDNNPVGTHTALLPNLRYPEPVPPSWITVTFPPTFRNVASVTWPQHGFGPIYTFDNINLEGGDGTIPEPASFAYITNYNSGSVSVIDTSTNTVVATVPVGPHPFGVAVNAAGTRAYVTNMGLGSSNVSVIDTSTHTVVATVGILGSPVGVAVNKDGSRVYVISGSNYNVSVIDTSTNTVIATVPTGIRGPVGVVVTPDASKVYATIPDLNHVSVIDTSTNSVVATVPVGTHPYGLAVNPAGTRVYVANLNSSDVSVIDTSTDTVVATVPVYGPFGVAVNPGGTRVYVSSSSPYFSGVSVIDTSTNTVVATVPAGNTPRGVSVNKTGTRVYVANAFSNNVSVIDTSTNTVVATVPVGDTPFAFGQFIEPAYASDSDGDGVPDDADNCPDEANPSQSNVDGDTAGDLCDDCPADARDGCDSDGSAAEEISADTGGTVQTPDGQVTIEIGPGDLGEDTTISVTETGPRDSGEVNLTVGSSPGVGRAIALYDLEPDGLHFNSLVTLTVVADVTSLNATQRANLDLYRFDDTNDTFLSLGATCDVNEDPPGTFVATCSVELDHFSIYAIVAPLDLDNDGVPDSFAGQTDLCPDTAPGDPIDAAGCSDGQVDADGDGVCAPGAPSGGPGGCTGEDLCGEMQGDFGSFEACRDTLVAENCPGDFRRGPEASCVQAQADACAPGCQDEPPPPPGRGR